MDASELEQELRDNWMTRGDAARLLGVSPEWIRVLGSTGKVETLEAPGGRLFKRSDIEGMAQERTKAEERAETGKAAA